MKLGLKIFREGTQIGSHELTEGVYRVGRSEFSDIVLPGEGVSRSHLEIRVSGASAYFTNMAAAGKVRLNGSPKETSELGDGDEIQIAQFRLVLSAGAESAASANEQAAAMGSAGSEKESGPGGGSEEGAPASEQAAEEMVAGAFGGFGESPANLEGGEGAPDFAADAARALGEVQEEPAPNAKAKQGERSVSFSRGETAVDAKPVVAKLVFQEGARSGQEMFLEAYEVTFGRSKKADIYLDDGRLSRLHSKIIRVGNGYRLVDLNSRNGTFVNGMRVLEHPLASFDTIQLGNTKIRFLIHDALANSLDRAQSNLPAGPRPVDQTKSVQLGAFDGNLALQVPPEPQISGPLPHQDVRPAAMESSESSELKRKRILRIAVGAILGLLLVVLFLPSAEPPDPAPGTDRAHSPAPSKPDAVGEMKAPQIPKEYASLSSDVQRAIEGHYNSAITMASQQNYSESIGHLQRIHQYLPFYKDSLGLLDKYQKKLKEIEIAQAQERAKKDELQDLQIYLQEGLDYLSQGEFDRAAESFNTAIVVDPNNEMAIKGLKASEAKVRRLEDIPPDVDPEAEKRKEVAELFKAAGAALSSRSYQEAINKAKAIQSVPLEGDSSHIREAQQIIDRVLALQKEEFEPFLIQAKEKYAEGDYNASRDLCEEMVKRDANYAEAADCVLRARKQLNRLAREAYTHGYILESMNRIEEAKQYWNRARNYVREGDEYYDKVLKKLDNYQ